MGMKRASHSSERYKEIAAYLIRNGWLIGLNVGEDGLAKPMKLRYLLRLCALVTVAPLPPILAYSFFSGQLSRDVCYGLAIACLKATIAFAVAVYMADRCITHWHNRKRAVDQRLAANARPVAPAVATERLDA